MVDDGRFDGDRNRRGALCNDDVQRVFGAVGRSDDMLYDLVNTYGTVVLCKQQSTANGLDGPNGVRAMNHAAVEFESETETAQIRHLPSVGGCVKDLHQMQHCVILTVHFYLVCMQYIASRNLFD